MELIIKSLSHLNDQVTQAAGRIKLDELLTEQRGLEAQVSKSDFWQDSDSAQKLSKKLASLKNRTLPWVQLQQSVKEACELAGLKDVSLLAELEAQAAKLEVEYQALKIGRASCRERVCYPV